MRKKLIDSSKSDLKKYMMIVESAGKVPASTEEDFTLEDIENPYFQGDEDTEESEGNRYYVTVGVKIGYDETTDLYFPEVIWDTETGTEIEFDKLDKISKKSIQDKCNTVGSKMSGGKRNNVSESTQVIVKALMQKFPHISESRAKQIVTKVSESIGQKFKVSVKLPNGETHWVEKEYGNFSTVSKEQDATPLSQEDVDAFKAKYGTRFDVSVKPTSDVKKFPKTQKISSVSISKTLTDNHRISGDLSIKRLSNDLVSIRQGGKEVCSVTAAGFSKLEFPDQIVSIHSRMSQGIWTGKYTFSLDDEFTGTFSLKDENNKEVLSFQTV